MPEELIIQYDLTDSNEIYSEREYVLPEPSTIQQDSITVKSDLIKFIRNQQPEMIDPLFFVDDKEVASINDVKVENIHSISVLKEKSATDIYGTRGKNGVILITTNKGESIPKETVSLRLSDTTFVSVDDEIINDRRLQLPSTTGVIFIVDGKEVSNADDLKHEEIESISVLKSESAIAFYGKKAKNGAVIITMKK
jgi:TonB-dependent SusC/RagA subfamily outer membrane receptor